MSAPRNDAEMVLIIERRREWRERGSASRKSITRLRVLPSAGRRRSRCSTLFLCTSRYSRVHRTLYVDLGFRPPRKSDDHGRSAPYEKGSDRSPTGP
eukprot:1953850-Prymnesium_polylepis.1